MPARRAQLHAQPIADAQHPSRVYSARPLSTAARPDVRLALASLSSVVPESLIRAIGTPIRRVRRMHYVFNDKPDTDFGPIELTLGEQLFLFDNKPDGESLRITEAAWTDPF